MPSPFGNASRQHLRQAVNVFSISNLDYVLATSLPFYAIAPDDETNLGHVRIVEEIVHLSPNCNSMPPLLAEETRTTSCHSGCRTVGRDRSATRDPSSTISLSPRSKPHSGLGLHAPPVGHRKPVHPDILLECTEHTGRNAHPHGQLSSVPVEKE